MALLTLQPLVAALRWSDLLLLKTLADFRGPRGRNMSLKRSEKDRLKDFPFLEKLRLAAYFPFVSDDSHHGEMMSCDSPLAFWCCPSSQQRLRGAGGGGLVKAGGREGGIKGIRP